MDLLFSSVGIVIRKYIENAKAALSFSLLLITAGLWLIRGSDFVCLLFTNNTTLYYIGYILFLQIPTLFFSFSIHYWQINCKVWKMNVYYFLSIANMVGCIILHMFNITEFKQSSFHTHFTGNCTICRILWNGFAYTKIRVNIKN